MLKSLEAVIEEDGEVHLREPIHLSGRCRAIVTIIEEGVDAIPELAEEIEAWDIASNEALANIEKTGSNSGDSRRIGSLK